jgi:hypothetical protein
LLSAITQLLPDGTPNFAAIEKTGRGRFRLRVDRQLRLSEAA